MAKICGIYTITNKIDGKIYVGQSIDCKRRLRVHYQKLRDNKHRNIFLQRSISKYGIENFEFEILEEWNKELLNSMELFWINILSTDNDKYGYNFDKPKPDNSKIVSNSTRKKMSDAAKGRKMSEKLKAKLLQINKGKIISEEIRDKISKSHKNKIYHKVLDQVEKNKIKLLQYDLEGNFIKEWNSMNEASIFYNTSDLSSVCKSEYKSSKGFMWRKKLSEDILLKIEPHKKSKKSKHSKLRYNAVNIIQLDIDKNPIKIWNSVHECINNNFFINYTIRRKNKLYRGFYWIKIDDFVQEFGMEPLKTLINLKLNK